MKTNFFVLILGMLCLYSSAAAQSNTLTGFNGKIQFNGFANNGLYIRGTLDQFVDQTNQYSANEVDTADVVWDNLGRRYAVVGVISSNLTQAVVDLSRIGGGSHIPTGVGFVCRETESGLSLIPTANSTGISAQLLGRVLTHNMEMMKNWGNGIISALPLGSVNIEANNNSLTLNDITALRIVSGGRNAGSTIISDVFFEQKQYFNQAKTKSLSRFFSTDTRPLTVSPFPNITEIWEINNGTGGYEWGNATIYDTINSVFIYKFGGRNGLGMMSFNSRRPSTGTAYLQSARYPFFATNSPENETNNSFHTAWLSGNDYSGRLMVLKDGGKFYIANDSSFIHDPIADSTRFNGKVAILQGLNYFQIKPFYNGINSTSTDGSGDITVTIPTMPDATYTTMITVEGTASYTVSVHTKTTTSFKVRFYNPTNGAAVTATAVSCSYEIKDY